MVWYDMNECDNQWGAREERREEVFCERKVNLDTKPLELRSRNHSNGAVGSFSQLATQPILQAGNGAISDRTPECWKDFPCKCCCCKYINHTGGYSEDMIPTVSSVHQMLLIVGFNMRKVTKGNVTIKLWDLGGQPRFRSMWERYCRAVSAIVSSVTTGLVLFNNSRYVVDAADPDNLSISRSELHDLLSKPSLNGIPLLVLGNKIDKAGALSKQALTDQMDLKSITDREVCCFMISCKNSTNIDSVIDWLVKHSKSKS
ncbi:hypothetical protein Ahy_B05g079696 isoform A [Arachis hypogaea]|uniref:ADP-ribosylation factor-like protein 8A n=1 Tax=Arachis hypogaea TaxID=3818 RepID=A0A444ZAM2_ARAHY|nr:hypothetical protein Ahy_B05g079696 isoform A [Arachis hypogaea]